MIAFGANFSVNKNVYNKLDAQDIEVVDKTISDYKNFLKCPKIEALTKDDAIELKRAKHHGGFALELEIKNKDFKEPFITGVYTNKKQPTNIFSHLKHETLLYICYKNGEKPRFFESSFGFIKRVFQNL